jgi:hypothetical protein
MLELFRRKLTTFAIVLGTGLLWGVVEFVALQRAAVAGRRFHKH